MFFSKIINALKDDMKKLINPKQKRWEKINKIENSKMNKKKIK